MNYEKFKDKYDRLMSMNQNYEIIIYEFVRRLEKDNSIELEPDFKKHFLEYKKAKNFSYEEISSLLYEQEIDVSVDTLKSYSRKDRKGLTSKHSKAIASLFNVPEDMILYGKDRISIMSVNSLDVKEMFQRLSEQNQKAVIYLLDSLYMVQIAPEIFEIAENK